jgi:hypothetical protein
MATWTIKSQTNEPDLALEIVEDQRKKGYNAWIEDENGTALDERSLKTTKRVATERTVPEWRAALEWRAAPLLFVFASVAGGFVFLYLLVCGLTIINFKSFVASAAVSAAPLPRHA